MLHPNRDMVGRQHGFGNALIDAPTALLLEKDHALTAHLNWIIQLLGKAKRPAA